MAGFMVAAPAYPYTKTGTSGGGPNDVPDQGLDASYVITQVLALNNTSSDMFNGHIRTACVGAAGHSLGGGTTEVLLTIHRDNRIIAAVEEASFYQGTPSGPPVKVLHEHGTNDPLCSYSGSISMYNAYPSTWPKAFLTVNNGAHDLYVWNTSSQIGYHQGITTDVDWMRYALYGDTAARGRLSSDATSSVTSFMSSGL